MSTDGTRISHAVNNVSTSYTGNRRFKTAICLILASLFVMTIALRLLYHGHTFASMNFLIMSKNTSASIRRRPRVICMILTTPGNWKGKGKAVRNTWAKRCHKAIFFYSRVTDCTSQPICTDPSAVGLNIPDGREHLTAKSNGALNYSYHRYRDEGDYFLKADDDTYVIMENLQFILSNFSSIPLLYLGRTINNIIPKGYNSGGAGYIISNKAAELMIKNGTSFPNDCHRDGGYEDVEIGRCLAKFGIYPQEEMDSSGRLVFHSDNPLFVLRGDGLSAYYYINLNGAEFGNRQTTKTRGHMLSNLTATMHYVSSAEMYMFEFLLYHLRRGKSVD